MKKPLKKNEKIIAKTPSNLVRRYANKNRRKKHMRGGGITPELNKTLTDFLNKRADTIYYLKIILLDRLCDAIVDTTRISGVSGVKSSSGRNPIFELDTLNHNKLYIQFRDNKELYDYDLNINYINFFGHSYFTYDTNYNKKFTDIYNDNYQDIDNIVYILKIMNNIYSLFKDKPTFDKYKFSTNQEFSFNENDEPIRGSGIEKFIDDYKAYKTTREKKDPDFPNIDSLLNPKKEYVQAKIIQFLKDNMQATYNLKIELLDKLSIVLMEDIRDNKFKYNSRMYHTVYISFNEYNSLYDYNLYKFIHDDSDDVYDDINEFIYILKIINNIYSLVKKNYKNPTETYNFVPAKRWLLGSDYRRPKDKEAFIKNYKGFKDEEVVSSTDKNDSKTIIAKLREVFQVEWNAKSALVNFIKHINKEGINFTLERDKTPIKIKGEGKGNYVLKYDSNTFNNNATIKEAIKNINESLKSINKYYDEALRMKDQDINVKKVSDKITSKIIHTEDLLNVIITKIDEINNEINKIAKQAKQTKGGNIAKYKNPLKKKDVKSIKNITKGNTIYASDLYNAIKSLNKMRGGMSDELIRKIKEFLIKYAEKTKDLKNKLLDELCVHTSKAEDNDEYIKSLETLKKINDEFTSIPKLYEYNIKDDLQLYHQDIKKLVYALKLVRSISLGLKKSDMKTLENDALKLYTFDSTYIPEELLNSITKENFKTKYEEIKTTRSNNKAQPPKRPPPQPLPQRKPHNDTEGSKILLQNALTLLEEIFVHQEEQLPEAAFKLLKDIVSEKEGRVAVIRGEVDRKVAIGEVATVTMEVVPAKKYVKTTDNSLKERITRYERILKILNINLDKNLKSFKCLNKQTFEIEGTNHNGYTIGASIELKEKIGETSDKDLLYLTYLTANKNLDLLACKLMKPTTKNRNEIKINEWIKDNLILNSLSKHFALTFKSTECITREIALGDNEKLVNYTELFDADIRTLLKEEIEKEVIDTTLIWNILYQCLICIATYQNSVGYYHNNTKLFNFKYQTNTEDGYYYYKYNDKEFYIKSCKYNIIIDDFKNSVLIDNNSESNRIALQKDYTYFLRDFSSFLRKKNENNLQENRLLIQKIIDSLNDMSRQISHDNDDIFGNIKNIFFVVNESGIILVSPLEKTKKLLNTTPFIINNADKQIYLLLNNDNSLEERINRCIYLNKTYSKGFSEFPINDIYYPINKTILRSSDLTKENVRNCIIQEWITKNLILNDTNQSKHFSILYGNNDYLKTLNIRDNKREPIPKYTEKCENSLRNIVLKMGDSDFPNIAINMLYQTFICIATYHNMVNFVFENITLDNFLLQTNDYNEYYHYKYDDKDFYIKSCEYNIIIDDFRNSQIIDIDDNNSKNMILQNYIDIVDIFQDKFKFKKTAFSFSTPQVWKDFEEIKKILTLLKNKHFSFENIILSVFNKYIYKQNNSPIYTEEIPSNSILNSKPFIIRSKIDNTNLENEKILLIKAINKAVLNEDEKAKYLNSERTYTEFRNMLKIQVESFATKDHFQLKNNDGIREFEVTDKQLSDKDKQILDNINILLSKMDNTKKKVLKKQYSADYITYTNFLVKEKEELEKDLTAFTALLKTLLPNASGGNPPKYKSTGKAVYILYKKKKYKRTIYVKDKRKTKYCKINNEYILLSKLKVLQGTLM
jgi:hypothetical protein